MRPFILTGFLVMISMLLSIHVSAAEFMDDMSAANNSEAVQYIGLRPYSGNVGLLSDTSMLTFSNISSPKGRAVYRVNNPGEVTAGIYTYSGTAVSQGSDGLVMGMGGVQATWSAQSASVYTNIGGMKQLGLSDRTKTFLFMPVVTPPASDVAGYGINIYYSSDGTNFSRAAANLSRIVPEALCYEEYSAYVPSSAKYVAVEINDVTFWPLDSGGYYQNDNSARYTRLALVRISGDGLIMGELVEEIVSSPEPSSEEESVSSVSSSSSSSSRASRKSNEAVVSFSATNEASKAKEKEESVSEPDSTPQEKSSASSSKFEGTIVSSSKSARSQSSKQTRIVAESSQQESANSQSVSESEPSRDETIVYELKRGENNDLLGSGVTVYIIAVTGTIVLLLLFGRKH